jgi:hypothetical protein
LVQPLLVLDPVAERRDQCRVGDAGPVVRRLLAPAVELLPLLHQREQSVVETLLRDLGRGAGVGDALDAEPVLRSRIQVVHRPLHQPEPRGLGAALNVQSGTLTLAPAGGASTGGTFTVASSAALDLTGGQTVAYAGTYTGSGDGQVQLNSGTLQVVGGSGGATFSFPNGLFRWNGGTINTNDSTLTIAAGHSIQVTGFTGEVLTGGGSLAVSGMVSDTGVGNLRIDDGTTLCIAKTGTFNLQTDAGIQQGSGAGGLVLNAGTLEKTVGTNVSAISTLLNNPGTVEVDTGTLDVTGAVSQVTGTTLEAGTWRVSSTPTVQSTLTFASPPSLTAIGPGATVELIGPNSVFTNLAGISTNAGSFSLTSGQRFTTPGGFTNSGTLSIGSASSLHVAGGFAETQAAKLCIAIAGTPTSGLFGQIFATGTATLAGTLNVSATVSPPIGVSYQVLTDGGQSGAFDTLNGLTLDGGAVLQPVYNSTNFTLTTAAASTPTLAPITNQTVAAGQSLTLTLQGNDPNGLPLTYSASVDSLAYHLKSTLDLYTSGNYYTNVYGGGEQWVQGTGGVWYYILPSGAFYKWSGVHGQLTGTLVAQLAPSYNTNPSLLVNAQPGQGQATVSLFGAQLTITPNTGFVGVLYMTATVSDGSATASQTFQLTVTGPTLAAIPDQTVAAGHSLTLTLQGSDPNGLPLTYSAVVDSLAYRLKSTLGLYSNGNYYTNWGGAGEQWVQGTGGTWYYILPSGAFYKWSGLGLNGTFVAQLDPSYNANPSLLVNARPGQGQATASISGAQLTITPNAGFTGVLYVTATVTDGQASASQTFTVTVS